MKIRVVDFKGNIIGSADKPEDMYGSVEGEREHSFLCKPYWVDDDGTLLDETVKHPFLSAKVEFVLLFDDPDRAHLLPGWRAAPRRIIDLGEKPV